ncbi:MAG: hypothetical protein V3V08_01800 [Nannocystaceae bacterium]
MTAAFSHAQLLAWRNEPIEIGAQAAKSAALRFGNSTWIRDTPPCAKGCIASIVRNNETVVCDAWPSPEALDENDRVVLIVSPDTTTSWLAYLDHLSRGGPERFAIAPLSRLSGATFKLWLIASARLILSPGKRTIHVEACHDALGVGLAQVALDFGANVLAGPIDPDRHLPLAGVSRPTERTFVGLTTLVEQAGRIPRTGKNDPFAGAKL